jgi:hypothetical protein
MRFAADGSAWDRMVPAFVLPYAVWTLYVQAIVAAQASFTTLMRGLPLVALAAVAATAAWFRLRQPEASRIAGTGRSPGPGPVPATLVLACATGWVALLSAGMPYVLFWWGALLATGWAWVRTLRAGACAEARETTTPVLPAWLAPSRIVPCVVVAAVAVVLVANRPGADDAFYLSIPATLLRHPEQPVLLHDTMYRLTGQPIMLPFYRLSNYDVLAAVVARLAGIDHLVAGYLVVPAIFAAAGVLAWVFLLRRLVPGRWPLVLPLLFLCVMALGETNRAYGNFAFVRMFHGKAALATCIVPALAASALDYARHGGLRRWLLLFAAQVAALGVAASALFVAPATVALGLAGGWSPDRMRSRRFVLGMLGTAYLVAAAWLVGSGTQGAHALALPAPQAMPTVPRMLEQTWGPWSTRVLLVALLSAWGFVRDPIRARYFAAGAFFFLLAALDPYTTPWVAAASVGYKTYWRLTWALPLPFFLAVALDGLLARALAVKSKALAAWGCLALALPSFAFAARFGTLLCANSVTLGVPGPKVPLLEYGVARIVARQVPERGVVLAPEPVAEWLPVFVAHPQAVGVRHMYLGLAFPPAETAQRSNMMRYVEGRYRPPGAARWFADALRDHRVTAVVFARTAPWRDEIAGALAARGWRQVAGGTYEVMVQPRPAPAPDEP